MLHNFANVAYSVFALYLCLCTLFYSVVHRSIPVARVVTQQRSGSSLSTSILNFLNSSTGSPLNGVSGLNLSPTFKELHTGYPPYTSPTFYSIARPRSPRDHLPVTYFQFRGTTFHLVLVPFVSLHQKIWNSLPPHILQSQTLDSFRRTIHFRLPTILEKQSPTVPKLFMLCECYDVTASQVTPYKQFTVPLLLQSCYVHVVHGAASLQLVIRNELTRFCIAVNATVSVHWI